MNAVKEKQKKYAYSVTFEDGSEPKKGTTEASCWEYARIKVEQFWQRHAPIEKIEVHEK